ncbi:MAG: sulfite exporter TauE/SafE family protein [Candidatus Aenigmarchaeota archaeon]|nr:sulfite exporter TauE/SafE family protein [Candidatus Aenigmarchaeota archaeon]
MFFRKHIDWKITFLIWAGAVPLVVIGSFLMVHAPGEIIKKLLGAIILLYIVNDHFKLTKHIKLNNYAITAAGGVYGSFAGIIGTGSAIKAALLNHLGLRKENFIATMSATAVLLNILKTVIYSKYSLISKEDTLLIVIINNFCGLLRIRWSKKTKSI